MVRPASIFASNVWISLSLCDPFTMFGPVALRRVSVTEKGVPAQAPFDLQTAREAFTALPRHVQKSAVMNITGVVVSGTQKYHKWGPQWADQLARGQRPEWTHLAVAHQCPEEPLLRAVSRQRATRRHASRRPATRLGV